MGPGAGSETSLCHLMWHLPMNQGKTSWVGLLGNKVINPEEVPSGYPAAVFVCMEAMVASADHYSHVGPDNSLLWVHPVRGT